MNAIEMLKDDHRTVRRLSRDYESAGDDLGERLQIAQDAFVEMEIHTRIEEEIFFPAVRAKSDSDGRALVMESVDEHQALKESIQELRRMNPRDAGYDAKFRALAKEFEHHVAEEEADMLPDAERCLGDDVDRLAKQMRELKSRLAAVA